MGQRVLVIGAHPDDEVLGCGGTIAKHSSQGDEVIVLILTDGESSRESFNTLERKSQLNKACAILGVKQTIIAPFKDSLLDSYPLLEVVREVEKVAKSFRPHILYTHSEADLNIDHTVTHRAVLTAFRPLPQSELGQIHTFEIPSSSEWGSWKQRSHFIPNYFSEIDRSLFDKKMEALKCYEDELRSYPHPRSEEYIEALLKVRGGSVGVNLAEAFFTERIIQRI
jgi:LmbE family N-acetylglucosaminyl deacetylase